MPLLLVIARVFAVIAPAVMAVRTVLEAHASANTAPPDSATTLLQKIESLIATLTTDKWQDPTSINNDIADIEQGLSALGGSGLLQGQQLADVQAAEATVGKFAATEADYMADEPAILFSNFSLKGKDGDILALSKQGMTNAGWT